MGAGRHIVFDCDGTLLNTQVKGLPYEGIPELLHRLLADDCRLYVWTGRDRASTLRLLQEQNLLRYFHDMRTASEMTPKPHPQGLQDMLNGVDPSFVVVVGDSWADMKGARLFGASALGATWNPQASIEALTEFGAQALAATPRDCYDTLLRLLQG